LTEFLRRFSGYLPAAIALALPAVGIASLFIPIATDVYILPRAALVIAGACIGIGLALLLPGSAGLGPLRWPLAAAAAAAVLAFLLSVSWPLSLAGAYTRYESLPTRLAYIGLLAASVWLMRDSRARSWVVPAFVFGTSLACLVAIGQWWTHAPFRPDGNLGNANLLGALVAMALPLAVARIWRDARTAQPCSEGVVIAVVVAWSAAIGILVAGAITTTSRSGWLAALAGCLAFAVCLFRGRAAITAAVASCLAVAIGLFVIVFGPLRLLNDDPGQARYHLYLDGLSTIAARPLTGWGPDTTGLAFGRFLSGDWSPGVTFDRIHSGPLDIAAMQGLLGLAALGWVLIVFFRGTWKARFTDGVAGLIAACVAYTVWVAVNFDWAPATGMFWLLAGTAWSAVRAPETTTSQQPMPGRVALWRPAIAVFLVAAATAFAALPVLADVWYSRGRSDLAARADPLQAQYHWTWGQTLISRGQLAAGVDELRRAAELGETEPSLYVELGDRETQLGRQAQARADYQRALVIDPYYAPAQQRLAGR
jgi:O-antigen ligase